MDDALTSSSASVTRNRSFRDAAGRRGLLSQRPSRADPTTERHALSSNRADVLELPGIRFVEIFGKHPAAIDQRMPLGILADHQAEIRPADLQDALVVEVVRFDDTAVRVFDRPDQSCQRGDRDLQGRRAIIMGMNSEKGYEKLLAKVPLKEMSSYSTSLSSITGGRASFTMKFSSYELVPSDVQDKLLKAYEATQAED